MADFKHIIEPERMGLWVAATFIVALLALVLAFVAVKRNNDLAYMTQMQFLMLNNKVEQGGTGAAAPAAPAPEASAQ